MCHANKILNNTKGSLSIDFLFASILVMGVTGILFALSFTLMVVEVTQYIAFATARNYVAAHLNEESQTMAADEKFRQLSEETMWRNLYKKDGWFVIKYLGSRDYREDYPPSEIGPNDNARFWGTKIELESKVLDFRIPFVSSTNPEDEKFLLNINSFLGREVSTKECIDFVNERFAKILELDAKYASQIEVGENYTRLYDNGC